MATDNEVLFWLSCLSKGDDETLTEALNLCDGVIKNYTYYREQIIAEQQRRIK